MIISCLLFNKCTGIVLYQLVMGHVPFPYQGDPLQLIHHHLAFPPPLSSSGPTSSPILCSAAVPSLIDFPLLSPVPSQNLSHAMPPLLAIPYTLLRKDPALRYQSAFALMVIFVLTRSRSPFVQTPHPHCLQFARYACHNVRFYL